MMHRRHARARALRAAAVIATLIFGSSAAIDAQLGSRTADEWVATLETPSRIASLKIDDVVGRLRLKPGDVVADIGAGSGLFEGKLAEAVGSAGTIYAEDVDPKLLTHIADRAAAMKLSNVRTVLGTFTDPKLPARNVDVAFIYDVLHHIGDRAAYLKTLATYLKPTGRIAVVEFHPERGGHPNQPELHVPRTLGDSLLASAGFTPAEVVSLFDEKWFVIYARSAGLPAR
jgi:cyclopropane fatty-acyl-phospholipid synthase-like methyltransferase